jgi:hypothetical protein
MFGTAGNNARHVIGLARLGQLFADFVAAPHTKPFLSSKRSIASAPTSNQPNLLSTVANMSTKQDKSFMGMPVRHIHDYSGTLSSFRGHITSN